MIEDSPPGLLVVVSGPSGVGKGTVVSRLLDELPDACVSVSVTTRAPRPGEVDGVDYHFVDEAGFQRMVDERELLEWAEYTGSRYGTPRAWVAQRLAAGDTVFLEIEIQGAVQIRERVPDALLVFLVPPDMPELERRLSRRNTENDREQAERLATAKDELMYAGEFDHVVINDDIDACVATVYRLVEARRGSVGGFW